MYYAQFANDICIGITETHSPLPASPDLMEIDSYDASMLGKTRTGSTPAAPVTASRVVTKLQFMGLFTDAELAAIYTAAKSVIAIEIWLDKFKLASEVDLDDPQTADGQRALEAAGLIGAGRAAAILSNTPPAAAAQV